MMKIIAIFPVIIEVRISAKAPSYYEARQYRYRMFYNKLEAINLYFTGYAINTNF